MGGKGLSGRRKRSRICRQDKKYQSLSERGTCNLSEGDDSSNLLFGERGRGGLSPGGAACGLAGRERGLIAVWSAEGFPGKASSLAVS